jgi:hypothetical protein
VSTTEEHRICKGRLRCSFLNAFLNSLHQASFALRWQYSYACSFYYCPTSWELWRSTQSPSCWFCGYLLFLQTRFSITRFSEPIPGRILMQKNRLPRTETPDEGASVRPHGCSRCGATPASQFLNNQLLCSRCYEGYSTSRLEVSEGIFLEMCRGAGRLTGKVLRHIRGSRSHALEGELRKKSALIPVQATEVPFTHSDHAPMNPYSHPRELVSPKSEFGDRFARVCKGVGAVTGKIVRRWKTRKCSNSRGHQPLATWCGGKL